MRLYVRNEKELNDIAKYLGVSPQEIHDVVPVVINQTADDFVTMLHNCLIASWQEVYGSNDMGWFARDVCRSAYLLNWVHNIVTKELNEISMEIKKDYDTESQKDNNITYVRTVKSRWAK